MKTFELFAGCGGLARGLELAGFEHAGLLEFAPNACNSLRLNFDPSLVHECDVRTMDFTKYRGLDMVSGGPPCQPFSLGGLARANADKRDMFPEAARAVNEVCPRAFMFENVKGLLRPKFRPYYEYIISRLSYPGIVKREDESWEEHATRIREQAPRYRGVRYNVQYKLLNAVDYGVPQVRERVFIVGIRSDIKQKWEWPQPTTKDRLAQVTVRKALRGLPEPQSPANKIADHVFQPGARPYPGHTGSALDAPSKTIKAGAHGVPGGENMIRYDDGSCRYMTIHEAKLIQSFPEGYKISGVWSEAMRQIGNAVPVKLAQAVGSQLRALLERDASDRR